MRFWDSTASAWIYCNPVVIVTAVLYYILFARLNIQRNAISKVANNMASAGYSIFLAHSVFLAYVSVKKAAVSNPIVILIHIAISSIGIYFVYWCVHWIYHWVMDPILKYMSQIIPLLVVDLTD